MTVSDVESARSALTDRFIAEDDVLRTARARALQLGVPVPSPTAGATLRFLAAVLDAHSVVEIGTGTGVSGVWLLRGMRADGVLTSVDGEPEHQRAARETFRAANVAANRTRLIAGHAAEVLPRLTDSGYDLMWINGDPIYYAEHLREAPRLLRAGGIVAFGEAFGGGALTDPAVRDPRTLALRDLSTALVESDQFAAVFLPIGGGILAATKRAPR
jgi:predicted O-methyltransferase YrrM